MANSSASTLTLFLPLIVFFVIMWLFLIRPQRKKDKETRDMRNNLGIGDEITTIGGIVGTVLSVKEDSVVVYCGSDKIKMEFKKWAIGEVNAKKGEAKKDLPKESPKAASAEEKKTEKTEEGPLNFRKLERKEEEE